MTSGLDTLTLRSVQEFPRFEKTTGEEVPRRIYTITKLNKTEIAINEYAEAQVEITNTGDKDGFEVVQLYIQDMFGSITRPIKELKGFQKVFIKSGETKNVSFVIGPEQLSFFDENINFLVESGDFKIWIAGNSSSKENISLNYNQDRYLVSITVW